MAGLVCSSGVDDTESQYAKKSSPNRLKKGRTQRYNKFFPIKQEEPYKDRQGN